MRLAGLQILGMLAVANPHLAKLLAKPGDARAHKGEDRGLQQFWRTQALADRKRKSKAEAKRRGHKAWTQTAETGGKEDGGNKDEKRATVFKPWVQAPCKKQ